MILLGLWALLCWFVLLPGIYLLGSFFQRWISEDDETLRGIFYVALGLGALAYFIVLIGSFGALKLWPVLGLFASAFLLRYRQMPSYGSWIASIFQCLKWPQSGVFLKVMLGVFFLSVAATLFLTFLPEIAHDSLCYHLNLPKLFVAHASVLPMKYDLKSYQSQFMECLYTIGILFRSVPVAKIFHWMTGFLLVVSVMTTVRQRTASRALGVFMGTVLWLTPTFLNQVAMTYNDIAVAFYVWLAFLLFARALYSDGGLSSESRMGGDFFVSGILMGFAVSCKFLALTVALPMGVFALFHLVRRASAVRGRIFWSLCLFCAGVFLGGGYWFIRNVVLEGSPLYPLFTPGHGDGGLYHELYESCKAYKSVGSFFLLPFLLVFNPDPFERYAWIGPVFLLLVPFFLLGLTRGLRKEWNALAAFTLVVSLFFWYQLAQDARFLIPLFPIYLMTASDGVREFQRSLSFYKLWANGFKGAALALVLFMAGVGVYHYRVHFQALFQGWPADLFLRRLERTYPVAQWINENTPREAKIFTVTEYRQFYFDRPVIDVSYYFWVERISDKLSEAELLERFRKLGLTHVLRVARLGTDGMPVQTREPGYAVIDGFLERGRAAELAAEISSQNIREPRYRYRIYKLVQKGRDDNRTD